MQLVSIQNQLRDGNDDDDDDVGDDDSYEFGMKNIALNLDSAQNYTGLNIGLVRNFLRFSRKFPGTAESVLEYSILGVYMDGMNTVRMTIKLSRWKLISN